MYNQLYNENTNERLRTQAEAGVTGPDYSFRSELWLKAMVDKAKDGVFTQLVNITPELARCMLKRNPDNKKIRPKRVLELAREITEGRWAVNGETIVVSNTGELNDGQHRLSAIVHSNTPVNINVCFGPTRDSRFTTDTGSPKGVADFITMNKGQYGTSAAAAAKLLLAYERGLFAITGNLLQSKTEIFNFYNQNADEINNAVVNTESKFLKNIGGRSAFVVAYVLCARENPKRVIEFFELLKTGEGLKHGCPILQLRSHALELQRKRSRNWERLEAILRYWNSWVHGAQRSRNITLCGSYPEIAG